MIKTIVKLFSFFYPPKVASKLYSILNAFYTYWIMGDFEQFGKSSGISHPIYLVGGKYIIIGNNFSCDQRLRLDAIDNFLGENFNPSIIIGDNVSIQKDCHIGAINKIEIGNNVLLASKVYISDHSHGNTSVEDLLLPPSKRKLYSKGPVIIEDNVWLGEGVVILPGVTVGENSIVGANSVVTKSIPKNCVAAGNPAKIIKII